MKPFRSQQKGMKVTGSSIQFSATPGVAPEGQQAVNRISARVPAAPNLAGAQSGVAQYGTLPGIIEYSTGAGQMATGARTACAACVAEGTLVFADGKMMPIEQAVAQGVQRTFIDGRWMDVTAREATGVKEVVEIATTHGVKFKVTPDHRIMTDCGWVAAVDLRSAFRPGGINDNRHELDAPIGFEMSKTDAINRDDALLVGAIVGDGWTVHKNGKTIGTGFCYADDMAEEWKPLLKYAQERFGSFEKPRFDNRVRIGDLVKCATPQQMARIEWRNKNAKYFGAWMSKDHVPVELWASTPESIGAYLRGLFTTDGSISLKPRPGVHFFQTSQTLVSEIQMLLRSLGIYSTIYMSLRAPRYKNLYTLTIARHTSLNQFLEFIGFIDDHRQIPLAAAVLARKGKDKFSPERVKSVTPCGEMRVYDLSVPGPDAFLANGIRVHNCKHHDVNAWRKFLEAADNPGSTAEMRETMRTMRAKIMMIGYGYAGDNDDLDIERTMKAHGICRPMSDTVEKATGRDPFFWPVVTWREANCPPEVKVGHGLPPVPVVTAQSPNGFFQPKDLDAEKIGSARYDVIMHAASGRKP